MMAYYTKVFLPDEQVRHGGSLHWVIYLRAWFFLLLDILALVCVALNRSPGQPFFPSIDQPPQSGLTYVFWALFIAFLVIWPFALLNAWIRRASTEIVVTDKRVIFKEGFLRRRTMEM